jgi:RNA polymerase sigma-70 factor (ECF subfamily)
MKSCNRYDGIDPCLLSQVRYRARSLSRNSLMQGMELEDIEQELILDFLVRQCSYDPVKASWATFVDRVLAHKCASMIEGATAAKRGATVPRVSLDALLAGPDGGVHEPVDDMASDSTGADIRLDLLRRVAALPTWIATLMRDLCDGTMTEIARERHMPRTTLYGHMAVLRTTLSPLHEYLH